MKNSEKKFDKPYYKKVLQLAIYAGEIMMKNGAEIYRVEDTIIRMCYACGVKNTEVFATTMGIFISINFGETGENTQTYIKRMHGLTTDLKKISQVNDFSRTFIATDMTIDEAMDILREIDLQEKYPKPVRLFAAALVAAAFAIIFGGHYVDALVAAIAGGTSYVFSIILSKYEINYFIHGFVCCAIAAFIAVLAASAIPAISYTPVIIGTIMIYVPGVAITNSIRDFLSGDMLSGLARLTDAVITAASLAVGAGIVIKLWIMMGGVL